MKLKKDRWLSEHKAILPFCFDYKEQSCCDNCGFKYCKFYKGVKKDD